jgi:hypothetical protein
MTRPGSGAAQVGLCKQFRRRVRECAGSDSEEDTANDRTILVSTKTRRMSVVVFENLLVGGASGREVGIIPAQSLPHPCWASRELWRFVLCALPTVDYTFVYSSLGELRYYICEGYLTSAMTRRWYHRSLGYGEHIHPISTLNRISLVAYCVQAIDHAVPRSRQWHTSILGPLPHGTQSFNRLALNCSIVRSYGLGDGASSFRIASRPSKQHQCSTRLRNIAENDHRKQADERSQDMHMEVPRGR